MSIITCIHLADAFIQSDLQMRTIEAIKINKRAMIHECYNKPNAVHVARFLFYYILNKKKTDLSICFLLFIMQLTRIKNCLLMVTVW